MEHSQFLQHYRAGKLSVRVDQRLALHVMSTGILPKRYQFAHHFWSWAWMLSFPAFLAVGVLYKWWIGLLLLVFVTSAMSRAVKRSATGFMIDRALEDEEFFRFGVEKGILEISAAA